MLYKTLSRSLFTLFLLIFSAKARFLHADFFLSHEAPLDTQKYAPWLTGPLLAPSGHVIPKGHYNIEPYLFFTVNTGIYNSHWHVHSTSNFYNTSFQLPIQIGLIHRLDFTFSPQLVYNACQGSHYFDLGDMPVGFDFQLLQDTENGWYPAVKLTTKVNVPLGKYQHMSSHKHATDSTGAGSLLPSVALVTSKLYHFHKEHFMGLRLAFSYTIGTAVHVKGINTYGGVHGTRGVVYPGNVFSIDAAMEYSMTQRWVVACDAVYTHSNKTRFSGHRGTVPSTGLAATVGGPSGEQFSLAPALEYNWSANVGLIGGVWFTMFGRNATQFTSGVLALNIYI